MLDEHEIVLDDRYNFAANLSLTRRYGYVDLPRATLAGLLMLVSLPGAARAGPLEDAEAADRKDDYATAIPIYRTLAEKGNVSAQRRLGFFYESGVGVKRDWAESAKWFGKAADGGDESAVFVLSFLGRRWRDRGSASATPTIYELVEKVAKSGFAVAQFSLGVMYYPIGDPSFDATIGNPAEALVWYRRAASREMLMLRLLLEWPTSTGSALFKIILRPLTNGTTSRRLGQDLRTSWPILRPATIN
jgi:TPR repeat protein